MNFLMIALLMTTMNNHKETIVLGGGCFWCTEAVFNQVQGVLSVTPGYSGGNTENPTYNDVCSGETGHAEVIKIEFDPTIVPVETIIEIFFSTHDPTTLNRQGADVGTQYRSVIFYTSDNQKETALKIIDKLTNENTFTKPVVTEIVRLEKFFEAENYHRDYYSRNKKQPYCQFVIKPKVEKFRKIYKEALVK
ncbi:MAG: peptide-methionine (S)-S-oxide reductase MsrA [Bacteroidales bacterium]|nr:peptide-methionine (S)-S-oxide reductase MsrA [Bacteroidales bacterium]